MNNYEIETTFKALMTGDTFKLVNKATRKETILVKASNYSACIQGDYVHVYMALADFVFIQGTYDSEPLERYSNRQRLDSYA